MIDHHPGVGVGAAVPRPAHPHRGPRPRARGGRCLRPWALDRLAAAPLPQPHQPPAVSRAKATAILAQRQFRRARPNLFEQFLRWLGQHLGSGVSHAARRGGRAAVLGWFVLLAAVGIVVALVVSTARARCVATPSGPRRRIQVEVRRSATDWLDQADALRARRRVEGRAALPVPGADHRADLGQGGGGAARPHHRRVPRRRGRHPARGRARLLRGLGAVRAGLVRRPPHRPRRARPVRRPGRGRAWSGPDIERRHGSRRGRRRSTTSASWWPDDRHPVRPRGRDRSAEPPDRTGVRGPHGAPRRRRPGRSAGSGRDAGAGWCPGWSGWPACWPWCWSWARRARPAARTRSIPTPPDASGTKALVLLLGQSGAQVTVTAHMPGPDTDVALLAADTTSQAQTDQLATLGPGRRDPGGGRPRVVVRPRGIRRRRARRSTWPARPSTAGTATSPPCRASAGSGPRGHLLLRRARRLARAASPTGCGPSWWTRRWVAATSCRWAAPTSSPTTPWTSTTTPGWPPVCWRPARARGSRSCGG